MNLHQIETKKKAEIKQLYRIRFSLLMLKDGEEIARQWAKLNLQLRKDCFAAALNASEPSNWFANRFIGKQGRFADFLIRFDISDGRYTFTSLSWAKEVEHA